MSDRHCTGGCGSKLPPTNKSGFAYGHKNGCPAPPRNQPATSTALAIEEPIEVEIPTIDISLREDQIDRIWQSLGLRGKGVAIATVFATYE